MNALQENRHILLKVSNLYMSDKADQEDLMQEIALNAWKGIRNFRGEAKFSTWLYQVALNTAITYFKKDLKKQHFKMPQENPPEIGDVGNTEDEIAAMNKAIGELSRIDKALVSLYLDDYSYAEIAAMMGITANNVAVKMNRIKLRLKENSRKFL